MENTNDNSIFLLRTIVDRQTAIIDTQMTRMAGYLAIIEYISALARSKDVEIPMEKVVALIEAKNDADRQKLLHSFMTEIVHDVIEGASDEAIREWESGEYPVTSEDNWSSPEWDDGMYAPAEKVDTDITKWKCFDRKWRLFGDE